MGKRDRYYLNIVLCDLNNNQNALFKAISSINDQIGVDLNRQVLITLVTTLNQANLDFDLTLFSKLNIDWHQIEPDGLAEQLNNVLDDSNAKWITFMDSTDMFFSDGSLLDFIVHSNEQANDKDAMVFNYVYSVDDNGIVDFKTANYMNIIFGKYFRLSYLKDEQLYFSDQLHRYLADDFASRALELTKRTIWFELNNYYLSELPRFKDDFDEFCRYRKAFILFMQNYNDDTQQVINDISWSIVHAFSMLDEQDFNDANREKITDLVNLLMEYDDYELLLEKAFNNTTEFNTFKDFLEG